MAPSEPVADVVRGAPAVDAFEVPGLPEVGILVGVWQSLLEATEALDDEQWARLTDCPGWSVRDQLSHVIGAEHLILGDPAPPDPAAPADHVRNPIGAVNEAWVAARRNTSGEDLRTELVAVTDRRRSALAATPVDAYDEVGDTLLGRLSLRDFLGTRVFDTWVHEQDVRWALGRPGGLGGAAEELVLDKVGLAMGRVVGKAVAPPESTSVVWAVVGGEDLDARPERVVALTMAGGRAVAADPAPPSPTVTVAATRSAFWRLGAGRLSPEQALAGDQVRIEGDAALGAAVLAASNFMF